MSDGEKTASAIGSLGGKAAAKRMTAKERTARAKHAANARWHAKLPRATHGSDDHPMKIGEIEIPCYVLDNGMRVITHRGLQGAISMTVTGSASETANFVAKMERKGLDCKEIVARISSPTEFVPSFGRTAFGYEATLLADLCDFFLEARTLGGILNKPGERIAARCEILARGFARVGIIALVDEATGYQDARARDALAKILEAFVAKELQAYMKTFELEYYKEIARLKGWEFKSSLKMPRYLGKVTNDLVYSRLAPGVLEELRQKNPVTKSGRREAKHFQWLTDHRGHPELQKHLARITGWMEMSKTWDEFYRILNERKPVYSGRTLFPIHGEDGDEDPSFFPTDPRDPSERSLPIAHG